MVILKYSGHIDCIVKHVADPSDLFLTFLFLSELFVTLVPINLNTFDMKTRATYVIFCKYKKRLIFTANDESFPSSSIVDQHNYHSFYLISAFKLYITHSITHCCIIQPQNQRYKYIPILLM